MSDSNPAPFADEVLLPCVGGPNDGKQLMMTQTLGHTLKGATVDASGEPVTYVYRVDTDGNGGFQLTYVGEDNG
jgi:hypothetical protein